MAAAATTTTTTIASTPPQSECGHAGAGTGMMREGRKRADGTGGGLGDWSPGAAELGE